MTFVKILSVFFNTVDLVEETCAGGERRSVQHSSLNLKRSERAIIYFKKQTFKLFQRQHWENLWETGWSVYGLSRERGYHFELTKLNCGKEENMGTTGTCPEKSQLTESLTRESGICTFRFTEVHTAAEYTPETIVGLHIPLISKLD